MQDHTVSIDRAVTPPAIHVSPVFNVAVPFVDRHLEAGRGAKVAIRTAREEVTYAELAERVNRAGNVLRDLGAGPGDVRGQIYALRTSMTTQTERLIGK